MPIQIDFLDEDLNALQYAKWLITQGFSVIPVTANKRPVIKDWNTKMAATAEQAERLFGKNSNHFIGIVTSRFHQGYLVIVDIDKGEKKDGDITLAILAAEYEMLPETYTVSTPSGGRHLYYVSDKPVGRRINMFSNYLGESGVDVLANNSFAMAPQSMEGNGYTVINHAPVETLPTWFFNLVGPPREKVKLTNERVFESNRALKYAVHYLKNEATSAVAGAHRNNNTYKVACRMIDFGLNHTTTFELMQKHWNQEKAEPPWEGVELNKIVRNAWKYRTRQRGVDSYFMPTVEEATPFSIIKIVMKEEKNIPALDWMLGKYILRNKVTLLVSPGGGGKSMLTLQWAVALATGKETIAALHVARPLRVLIINNEDDEDDVQRRLSAIIKYFNLNAKSVEDNLFCGSGDNFIIGKTNTMTGQFEATKHEKVLREAIKENEIDVVIIDPLVSTHMLDENDNRSSELIMDLFRRIARQENVGIVIVHHTRKPPVADSTGLAGNIDSARGASAVANAARIGLTLFNMSAAEASRYGIVAEERSLYIRLDSAKANYSQLNPVPSWFRKTEVELENKDKIGVLHSVLLEEIEENIAKEVLCALDSHDKFECFRVEGEMKVVELVAILREMKLYCGASVRGKKPSVATVQKHFVGLVKGGELDSGDCVYSLEKRGNALFVLTN